MSQDTKLHRRLEDGDADPAFYAAIGGDATLRRVLDAFYDRVFVDPVLAPFFVKHDKATLKGKQFGFLRMRFTGERGLYMGQRPRNAHHWMVISDEQFDRRQALMAETLVAEGLLPAHVAQWLGIEEVFRRQIVKDRPWPLFYRGYTTYWVEGRRQETATVGTVCDACQAEIGVGAVMLLTEERVLCLACDLPGDAADEGPLAPPATAG
jgi:truncated hemoglobin YjbI